MEQSGSHDGFWTSVRGNSWQFDRQPDAVGRIAVPLRCRCTLVAKRPADLVLVRRVRPLVESQQNNGSPRTSPACWPPGAPNRLRHGSRNSIF